MPVDASVAALAAVRAYCRWTIGPTIADDELTLDGSGRGVQMLPTMQVSAVASVVDDGVSLVEDTDFYWSADGWLVRSCGAFTWKPRGVVVTLTHGYADLPDDVQAVVDRLAGRAGSDNGALRQVGQVQYATTTDGVGVGGTLTAADKAQLAPYRLMLAP